MCTTRFELEDKRVDMTRMQVRGRAALYRRSAPQSQPHENGCTAMSRMPYSSKGRPNKQTNHGHGA